MTEPRAARGRLSLKFRDPAEAVAAAKCWLAGWVAKVKRPGDWGLPPVDSFHPRKCNFCEVPRDIVIQALEEFRDWSGISDPADIQEMKVEVESFLTIPAEEQDRLVRKAMYEA